MPSSLHAQITRSAISPRFAIRIFLNMTFSFQLSAVSSQLKRWFRSWQLETVPLEDKKKARFDAPQQSPESLLRPDHKQFLAVFDRLAVDRELLDDFPSDVRLNLVEQ